MAILKESLNLTNLMLVKIHLNPMPKIVGGCYPKVLEPENFPQIALSFYDYTIPGEDGESIVLIKKLSWDEVFCDYKKGYVTLKGERHLNPKDVHELDELAWEVLRKYGLYPTKMLGTSN